MSRIEKVTRSVSDSEMRQRALLSARQLPSLAPEPKKKRKGKLKLAPSFESPAAMSASSPVSVASIVSSSNDHFRGQGGPSRAQKEIESVVAMWAAGSESQKKKRASIASLMGKRTRTQSLKQASNAPIKITPAVASEPSTPSSSPAVSPSSPRRLQLQQQQQQQQQHDEGQQVPPLEITEHHLRAEETAADSTMPKPAVISPLHIAALHSPVLSQFQTQQQQQAFELYCVTPRNLSPSDTPPLGYREILGRTLCKSEGSDSELDTSVRSDHFYDLSSDGESL